MILIKNQIYLNKVKGSLEKDSYGFSKPSTEKSENA